MVLRNHIRMDRASFSIFFGTVLIVPKESPVYKFEIIEAEG